MTQQLAHTPSNESIIYGFLDRLGITPAGDAALLGNFRIESGFSPTAYNSGEGAIGLGQWEKGRRVALQQFAAAHGGKETDLRIQLGFLARELRGPYSFVLRRLQHARNPGAAAAFVDANYEVSSGSTRGDRINASQTIYQQIRTGSLTPTHSPGLPPVTGGSGHAGGTAGGAAGFGGGLGGLFGGIGFSPSELLPWNWGKGISDAVGGVVQSIVAFLTKMLFVGLGLALVLLGIYTAARPEPGGAAT